MSNKNLIKTDSPFSEAEGRIISSIAGMIIPASDQYGIPGADDATISRAILQRGVSSRQSLGKGLKAIEEMSQDLHDAPFFDLEKAEQAALIETLRSSQADFLRLLTSLTIQAYYQDKRVLASMDIDPRPPFPLGHEVEQGDWQLLDPVREKAPIYRKV